MTDDNILNIILRFLVDEKSKAAAKKEIAGVGQGAGAAALGPAPQSVEDTYKAIAQYSKDFDVSTADAARTLAGMASVGQKTEQQILADVAAFQKMGGEAALTAQQVNKISKNTDGIAQNVKTISLLATGRAFMRLGNELAMVSQGLMSPIQSFTKYAGMASGASADYLQSQQRIEAATMRIGSVMTREIAPVMERAAELAEKVAGFVEAHPEIAKIAVGAAGLAAVAGGILQAAGTMVLAAAAIGKISTAITSRLALQAAASTATGAAAGAATGGFAATVAASGPPGWLLALSASFQSLPFLIGKAIGEKLGTWQWAGAGLAAGARNMGTAIAGPEVGEQWAAFVRQLTGTVGDLGDTSRDAAGKIKDTTDKLGELGASQAEVDAFIGYQKQETASAQDYEEQRLQLVEDYGKARADSESKYEQQRGQAIQQYTTSVAEDAANYARESTHAARTYYDQERQREADYYKERIRASRDYSTEVQRAEEDHQREMLRMQQEHNDRISDLSGNRDALGMVREMRDYERQRQEAEQEYNIEVSRRNQDFARKIADMEAQFSEERARRMQEYAQQRADAQSEYNARIAQRKAQLDATLKQLSEEHKTELVQLAKDQQDKLNTLQQNYNRERQQRYTAFAEQLRDLNGQFARETNLRTQYYDYWTKQFDAFIKNNLKILETAATPGSVPGRASGGYVGRGLYMMGEGGSEYVLSHTTTAMLEKLNGGRINQSTILSLAASGGGTTINYYDQKRIDGRVTASDKRMITQASLNQLAEVLNG